MVLVDLRNHGLSAALEGFEPPHDIPAAARDLADLIKVHPHVQPDVIIGHSLGGKVALDYVLNSAENSYGDRVSLPKQAWILDSVPGDVHEDEADGEVERVLGTIRTLPLPIPSRRWLVEHMTSLGFSKSLSDWLGTNLKRINPSSEKSIWLFNVNGIYDMFMSYRKQSYWPLLEDPPTGIKIENVRAAKSDRWTPDVISRLEQIVSKNKKESSNLGLVSYHILPDSGHWVHVDNPGGLIEIVAPSLLQLPS
ncbi:hypothetical protein O6H91_Y229100 [Diphasiastrum complanatum]|nr:hypothetical protein O6H91_Y229100 [Diphasiastrum complanatum]